MRIITDTETSILIAIGTFKEYWDNGYPIITDSNGNDCAYPTNDTTMHEVDSVPDCVEPEKFCYSTDAGFYENPNYIEPKPYGIPDDLVEKIKNDAISEVEQEVTNGTDR